MSKPVYTYSGDATPDADMWPLADVVTADGQPLYNFVEDDTDTPEGDGLGGVWHVYTGETKPVAEPVDESAPAPEPVDGTVTETPGVPAPEEANATEIATPEVAPVDAPPADAPAPVDAEPAAEEPPVADAPGDSAPAADPADDGSDAEASDEVDITVTDVDFDLDGDGQADVEVEVVAVGSGISWNGSQIAYDGKRYPIDQVPTLESRDDISAAVERLRTAAKETGSRPSRSVMHHIELAAEKVGASDLIPW